MKARRNGFAQMMRHALEQLEALLRGFMPDQFGHAGVIDGLLELVGQKGRQRRQADFHVDQQRLRCTPFFGIDPNEGIDGQALQEDMGRLL